METEEGRRKPPQLGMIGPISCGNKEIISPHDANHLILWIMEIYLNDARDELDNAGYKFSATPQEASVQLSTTDR
jgi:hypothetical protein